MKTRLLLLALLALVLSGCTTTQKGTESVDTPKVVNADPFEGFNRAIFSFNSGVDSYFLKPVTHGYRFITPDFVETGVSNFFSNLLEVRNMLNALLQGKGADAANYGARFLFNTTIGIGGLFDPATSLGIEKNDGEDFGQTLGAWGIKSGPYIVLPFLGPSNIRDGLSIPLDAYADPVTYLESSHARNGLTLLEIIDLRSKLLETEKLLSGDRYVFIRDAYLQRRDYLVNDGVVEDTFGTDLKGDF
jgi:phospholipid-binding lipoprotein MlaA